MNLEELRARLDVVRSEMRGIHEAAGESALNDEQTTRWNELDTEDNELKTKIEIAEHVAASRAKWGSLQVETKKDPFEVLRHGGYGVSRQAMTDAALFATDGRVADNTQLRKLMLRHGGDTQWAANVVARSRPEYASAFSKVMRGEHLFLSDEERAAMAVGTNTAGGYLVPTHLDPTLILTSSGVSNAIRGISRVVTLVGPNVWHGATTAGATASWDGELVEVSDDTPAVGTISISTFKAQALIQASIESFEDIAGLESDAMMILGDARDKLEAAAHATGPGTTAPKGVFTAVNAVSGSKITSATAATIALADLNSVYAGVPVRHRSSSTWCMNPTYSLAIKALGTAVSASFSGDLREGTAGTLLGRPLVESDEAPSAQTTTSLDQEVLLGNFQQYIIVDKPGSMAIEFIPHMFNTANNLPDGRRAWYMHWRTGADVSDANAFRLLVDKTSA
jgi:HK97 family phage major capsid protein